MGKPTICIGENKGADQLRGYREADQRLCFRYSDSTIPPLLNSKISSFKLFSVLVQAGLCRTCSETTLLVFPRGGSFMCFVMTTLACKPWYNNDDVQYLLLTQLLFTEIRVILSDNGTYCAKCMHLKQRNFLSSR